MKYKIIDKDEFELVGVKRRVTINHQGVNKEIKEMNDQITPEFISDLQSLPHLVEDGLINASLNFENRHLDGIGKMDRLIGVAVSKLDSNDFDSVHISKQTWAVFQVEGIFPLALQETWTYIKGDWLPESGYEIATDIELTRHLVKAIPGQQYKGEVWLAVIKK